MSVTFGNIPAELLEKFKELEARGKYPKRKSMMVPALHLAQDHFGWISGDAVNAVAEFLNLSPNYVKGDASFYTMFFMAPPGKFVLQICHNVTCYLLGAEDIVAHIQDKLGIKCGETTKDGMFSLITVECLAACGRGPVIQVNNREYHENMTVAKVDELIESLRNRAAA